MADQVPEFCVYALKTSRVITHEKRLQVVAGTCGDVAEFFFAAGQQLHAVLFPDSAITVLDFDRLKTFVELLYHSNPLPVHIAFRFRHHSLVYAGSVQAPLQQSRLPRLALRHAASRQPSDPSRGKVWKIRSSGLERRK